MWLFVLWDDLATFFMELFLFEIMTDGQGMVSQTCEDILSKINEVSLSLQGKQSTLLPVIKNLSFHRKHNFGKLVSAAANTKCLKTYQWRSVMILTNEIFFSYCTMKCINLWKICVTLWIDNLLMNKACCYYRKQTKRLIRDSKFHSKFKVDE